jgi:hypothetical protein
MINFKELKARRKDNLGKLATKLKSSYEGKKNYEDDIPGAWQPTADKNKSGYAIFRWLPGPLVDADPNDPDDVPLPYVDYYSHNFKGPGGWYINRCLTSIDKKDPAVEYANEVWGPNKEAKSQAAKDRVSGTPGNPGLKRKHHYVSYIQVIDDPAVPENNGKVFPFKYGDKIFEFLNEAMNPSTSGDTEWNPFDLWEGANFKLKFKQVEGYRNYGQSVWLERGPLFEDDPNDEKAEAFWKSIPSLKQFVAPDSFKSYADLKKRLLKVLGSEDDEEDESTVEDQEVEATPQENAPWEDKVNVAVTGSRKTRGSRTTVKPIEETVVVEETNEDEGEGEGDNMAFFEQLRDK